MRLPADKVSKAIDSLVARFKLIHLSYSLLYNAVLHSTSLADCIFYGFLALPSITSYILQTNTMNEPVLFQFNFFLMILITENVSKFFRYFFSVDAFSLSDEN